MKHSMLLPFFLGLAFASGTITPGSRPGGYSRCASSTVEGTIAEVNPENKLFVLVTRNNENRKFKVNKFTQYRIPGISKAELGASPLAKLPPASEAKVAYCTKDSTAVEIKIKK